MIWGPSPVYMNMPEWLSGAISLGGIMYPAYRFVIIVVGLLVATSGFMDNRPTSPRTHPIATPPYQPIPWLDYCKGAAPGGLRPISALCIPSS